MQGYQEHRFRTQVDKALTQVRKILKTTRHPTYAEDVHHKYDDKYGLAEFLTNLSLAAQLNCLELIGLDESKLKQLRAWASNGDSVTLRFESTERCTFLREVNRKEDSKHTHVTTGWTGTTKSKVVTNITEYFWRFYVDWNLVAYRGADPKQNDSRMVLAQRVGKASCEIMSTTKNTPRHTRIDVDPLEVNITWLVNQLDDNLKLQFSINREADSCRTPRGNEEVEAALNAAGTMNSWMGFVVHYFQNVVFPILRPTSVAGEDQGKGHGLDLASIGRASSDVFVPILPLFEDKKGEPIDNSEEVPASGGAVTLAATTAILGINIGDIHKFLTEQRRSLSANQGKLQGVFPPASQEGKLISFGEALIVFATKTTQGVLQQWSDSVQYIEEMLRKQLVAAVGKEVTPADFNEYMKHHNKKLYKKEYQPNPFCFAVRRPEHYPEGIVSIEAESTKPDEPAEPVSTLCRRFAEPVPPMKFRLNAATQVEFTGQRYLHAYVSHQFAGQSGASMSLTARARQFSSFILLLGRIGGVDTFEPKHAMIIKDKDDLKIPLLLETMPTAKEFKDAIESLSPEQQRFAKAYRSMQLEGSVFGVLIIQLKPQLEKLLNLPNDSLTKEIKLTQQLLDIFIEYQIPSDLVSFSGKASASQKTKLDEVKKHVKAIFDMIDEAKKQEVQKAKEKYSYQNPGALFGSAPGMAFGSAPTSRSRKMKKSKRAVPAPMVMAKSMAYAAPVQQNSAQVEEVSAVMDNFDDFMMDGAPEPVAPASDKPKSSEPDKEGKDWDMKEGDDFDVVPSQAVDFTKIPGKLDKRFLELDTDSSLRPTKINVGETWTKRSQKALLADPVESSMSATAQKLAKQKAFDLLDALSRSGALSIECAALHVMVATTHCFDDSLMNTVIVKNVNPIEKIERSSLIIATTIHDAQAVDMIKGDQCKRVTEFSAPALMPAQEPVSSIL